MLRNVKRCIAAVLLLAIAAVTWTVKTGASFDDKGGLPEKGDALAAMADVNSNRHTRTETFDKVPNRLNLDGYAKIMEDSRLEVWHREKNASIRVVDKATGYVWGGLAEEKPEDMNTTWSGVGNALVSIDYFDAKGLEKRLSIADKNVKKSFKAQGNILRYSVSYITLDISFDFEMELRDGSLLFRMIDDSIKEGEDYSLAAVYFVPFLGSTRADEIDGYMLVPDGPGALIRYSKPSQYLVNFDKRIYGKDYGIDHLFEVNDLKSSRPNDFSTEEPQVLMPVFGVVHGVKQNAYFARVEKGAEYASIVATPSGIVTNYNWISARFIYRQKYLQPTSKSGAGVQVAQKERNRFEAEISYRFLRGEDADYIGMAKLYRRILQEEGNLPAGERIDADIPLQLDIIGSDLERGFIFNRVLPITTAAKARQIAEDIAGQGISNITMVFKGWQKGGLNGSRPSNFSFESKVGGKKALSLLDEHISSKGGRFYYYENPVTVKETQIDLRQEGGTALSQSLIKVERDNDAIWLKDTYFVKADIAADYVAGKAKLYAENGMKGMALDEFGQRLYAENQRDRVTCRLDIRKKQEETAQKVLVDIENLAMYRPNQYLWKYSSEIFNVPVTNSQYLFETDTVPFMQIVLKGSVDYYAPYSNMSFYSRTDVLRMIEYGAYPAFLLTGLDNHEMEHTPISELYSTKYEDWKQHILEVYNDVNAALSRVEGRKITGRTVVSSGVVKMDYEGGVSILINYTGSNYSFGSVNIPAQSYAVLEGE